MIDSGKYPVLGVNIDAIDYESAVARIIDAAQAGKRCTVSALAVHGVMTGVSDPEQRYRLNHLDLVVPDGQPVRWALNALYGSGLRDRVYGPNLMLKVCAEAARLSLPVYFYGSTDRAVQQLAERLAQRFPGLQVAGFRPSMFRRVTVEERANIVDAIRRSGASILFVGLGCPRQETFAYEFGNLLPMPILAVGAAFDYHSGFLSEPPQILQRAGLQWLYRLAQEPRRLARRYLVLNTAFTLCFLLQAFRIRIRTIDPRHSSPPSAELLYG